MEVGFRTRRVIMHYRRITGRELAAAYLTAKQAVLDAGFEGEVSWQENACTAPLTEQRFLSEAAWVVLSSGMREAVVRRVFPSIAVAFGRFRTARAAALCADTGGREAALQTFGHQGKVDAIISIVMHVDELGISEVRHRLTVEGVNYLRQLPYLGPVTSFHLAKNLGHDVVKPDRHLARIAFACGYENPAELCSELYALLGEPRPVADVVLWRFATLCRDYIARLTNGAVSSGPN